MKKRFLFSIIDTGSLTLERDETIHVLNLI